MVTSHSETLFVFVVFFGAPSSDLVLELHLQTIFLHEASLASGHFSQARPSSSPAGRHLISRLQLSITLHPGASVAVKMQHNLMVQDSTFYHRLVSAMYCSGKYGGPAQMTLDSGLKVARRMGQTVRFASLVFAMPCNWRKIGNCI